MSSEKDQTGANSLGRGSESRRHAKRPHLPSVKRVVAALIFKHDQILVCQRTRHQTMPLKWEFPGGKIEEGEQPPDALRRELNEELGIDAIIGEEVARIRHEYKSGSAVELRFYAVRDYRGELENKIFKDMRWAVRSDLPSFDFLEADLQLVRELAEGKIASNAKA
jgi:8-oxo-dGTP diphosphatase